MTTAKNEWPISSQKKSTNQHQEVDTHSAHIKASDMASRIKEAKIIATQFFPTAKLTSEKKVGKKKNITPKQKQS